MDKKDNDNFFRSIPDDVFKKMKRSIEHYDKQSESSVEDEVPSEAFTTDMLITLSQKKLAEKKGK